MEEELKLIDLICIGHHDTIVELIQRDVVDVNEQDEFGNCPILMAANRNNLSLLTLLIKNGATVNITDHFGHTPLSWATKHNNIAMCQLIEEALLKESESKSQLNCK